MNSADTRGKIRKVESELLDEHYRRFPLLHRYPNTGLLHVVDLWTAMLEYHDWNRHASPYLTTARSQALSLRGLEHCVRWIHRHPHPRLRLPAHTTGEIQAEAMSFLDWGTQYERLTIDHIAWSRGALSATIEEDKKIISFRYPDDFDFFYSVTQQASEAFIADEWYSGYPGDAVEAGYRAWLSNGAPLQQGFFGGVGTTAREYSQVRDWLASKLLPEISDDADVLGYSLGEFRTIWSYLHLRGEFWSRAVDEGRVSPREMGVSQGSVFIVDVEAMVKAVSSACGILQPSVHKCIQDLVFQPDRRRGSLIEQPLIPTVTKHPGEIMLSPRLLTSANPWVLLTRLLTKSSKAQVYSTWINQLEEQALLEISSLFRRDHLVVLLEPRLVTSDGPRLTPDLLLLDSRYSEALLIEYKHALVPFGPGEALDKLDDVRNWITKLRTYERSFSTTIDARFKGIRLVGSLLLVRWPMPVPLERTEGIALIDRLSLTRWVSDRGDYRFDELLRWGTTRDDLLPEIGRIRSDEQEIRVGAWRYRRPVLVSDI